MRNRRRPRAILQMPRDPSRLLLAQITADKQLCVAIRGSHDNDLAVRLDGNSIEAAVRLRVGISDRSPIAESGVEGSAGGQWCQSIEDSVAASGKHDLAASHHNVPVGGDRQRIWYVPRYQALQDR